MKKHLKYGREMCKNVYTCVELLKKGEKEEDDDSFDGDD